MHDLIISLSIPKSVLLFTDLSDRVIGLAEEFGNLVKLSVIPTVVDPPYYYQ